MLLGSVCDDARAFDGVVDFIGQLRSPIFVGGVYLIPVLRTLTGGLARA